MCNLFCLFFKQILSGKNALKWQSKNTRKKGQKMIPVRYQKLVFAFFMALIMSCIMSCIISIFNVGFVPNIVTIWLKAWAFAFVVAFPTITLVAPIAQRLTAWAVQSPAKQ